MNLKDCVEELLLLGLDDWVNHGKVIWIARTMGGAHAPDDIRSVSLAIAEKALRDGNVEIGGLDGPGGRFQGWSLSIPEAIKRADAEWTKPSMAYYMDHVFWLCNTPQGDQLGNAAREALNKDPYRRIARTLVDSESAPWEKIDFVAKAGMDQCTFQARITRPGNGPTELRIEDDSYIPECLEQVQEFIKSAGGRRWKQFSLTVVPDGKFETEFEY